MKLIYSYLFALSVLLSCVVTGCGGEKKKESTENKSTENKSSEKTGGVTASRKSGPSSKKATPATDGDPTKFQPGDEKEPKVKKQAKVTSALPFGDLDLGKAKMGIEPGTLVINAKGKDSEGKPLALADYKGKVILLDTWASW